MRSIAEWLASLGLGEYAERFVENAVDLSVIRDLTDQDLKELGVLLGHRRKILRATAGLRGAPPRAGGPPGPPPRRSASLIPDHAAGQRRATPAYGDVLRSGRLDGPLGA